MTAICTECAIEFFPEDASDVEGICSECIAAEREDDALELAAWRAVAAWLSYEPPLQNFRRRLMYDKLGVFVDYVENGVPRTISRNSITMLADALGLEWRP